MLMLLETKEVGGLGRIVKLGVAERVRILLRHITPSYRHRHYVTDITPAWPSKLELPITKLPNITSHLPLK